MKHMITAQDGRTVGIKDYHLRYIARRLEKRTELLKYILKTEQVNPSTAGRIKKELNA